MDNSSENSNALKDRQAIFENLRAMLQPHAGAPTKEELQRASEQLCQIVPYNFEAWRLHADLLLNALEQLRTRQLAPDLECRILNIPLKESDLRDAAEAALRQCAHFSDSTERRIILIDEANRVRRFTWT